MTPESTLETAAQISRKRTRLGHTAGKLGAIVSRHQQQRLWAAGLFFFVLFVSAVKPQWNLAIPASVIFATVFSWLVVRTGRFRRHFETLSRYQAFLERQELRLLGMPSGRLTPASLPQTSTAAAHDLHYFGTHSLWSLIDETFTDEGALCLHQWMTATPPAPLEQLLSRQRDIQMLSKESWFFTRLILAAKPSSELRVSTKQIDSFLKTSYLESWFALGLGLVSISWLGFVAAIILGFSGNERWIAPSLAVFAFLNLGLIWKNGSKFSTGVGLAHHLSELEPIFRRVEKRTGESKRIRGLCPTTHVAGPSRESKKLSSVLTILGVETNPLLFLLINAVLPWSSIGTFLLERRRRKISESFPTCLRELAQLEVLGTFVLFSKFQTSSFPELNAQKVSFEGLYHPLVDRKDVVDNAFTFPADKSLGLITGSNMSGKSTFLRTVGINQCLANMGAPVFAQKFSTQPLQIETCIEVSDSLRDGFSYFYSEVRRLKALLNEVSRGTRVLYLIDEIFRGTNNRERRIGSRAVIRELARARNAQGFVSTHDLELADLERTERAVLNLHFKEDIQDSEMHFSYKLRSGPSPTTNALYIMRSEGIQIEDSDLTEA